MNSPRNRTPIQVGALLLVAWITLFYGGLTWFARLVAADSRQNDSPHRDS